MPAQVVSIPLSQVQLHPRLSFRFRYEVASLAESMRDAADENTPNGQLNPGRVQKRTDGEGYYVYVGGRRYLALKRLHEETKDERFGVYNAYVDEGLSELQMFMRARAENEEEKGERQGVSILEQASGLLKIKDSVKEEPLDPSLKRLLDIADRLGEERLKKLYDVERASRSKFRLAQLESLSRVEGAREFYTTAASTAGFSLDDVDVAEKTRKSAYDLDWFSKVFPDLKREEVPTVLMEGSRREGTNMSTVPQLEVHEECVIVADCPRCRGGNMLRIKGEIEVTHLPPNPEGERNTDVADAVAIITGKCSQCEREFYVFARHLEGKTYALSSNTSGKFREPAKKVEAIDVRFDFEGRVWQRIVDGKVTGTLKLEPKKAKK